MNQKCSLCTYLRFADLIDQEDWKQVDAQLAFYLDLSTDQTFKQHLLILTEPFKSYLTSWKEIETIP